MTFEIRLFLAELLKGMETIVKWGRLAKISVQEVIPLQISLPQAEYDQLVDLFNRGRYAELESRTRVLVEEYPDSGFVWKVMGASLKQQGKDTEALPAMQKATEQLPDDAQAHINLGLCLKDLGQLAEAVTSLRRALKIKPDLAQLHNNLGFILKDLGQNDEAVSSLRRALEINPDDAEAHNILGFILKDLGQLDGAVASYRRALEVKPDYSMAHNNLGIALGRIGQVGEAVVSFRRALEINPDDAEAHSNLLLTMQYAEGYAPEELLVEHLAFALQFEGPLKDRWLPHGNSIEPLKRLRVGYVSPDFRQHSVAFFIEPVFAHHDQNEVEVSCYYNYSRHDAVTERLAGYADRWLDCSMLSHEELAQRIRSDGIDILVDLAGHTGYNRLLTFARKPAPVQVTWLGYPGTTGLAAMDYRLTDCHTDPEGVADAFYAERLLRLQDSLWCYRPAADMPEVSPLPALARGYLTFGSFNNFNKIDQHTLELWAELLLALPSARLMILTVPEGDIRTRLVRSFEDLGVDEQRLEFHGKLAAAEFHRKFLEVDITLDPVNVNGATTTCESLWMGVPVISLVGTRFLTRAGLSILNTAGLADFAAASPKEYVRIAAHFADNIQQLVEIRSGLRSRLASSPLIDEPTFTRQLEAAYREVWMTYCARTAELLRDNTPG